MHIAISPARIPEDVPLLMELDAACFREEDCFDAETWEPYESFFMHANGILVGSCAFAPHRTVSPTSEAEEVPCEGSLYIVSTCILPAWQGKGLGHRLKAWQIEHARAHGFARLVTNMRISNDASRRFNEAHGFTFVTRFPGFYPDGEDAFVYERQL